MLKVPGWLQLGPALQRALDVAIDRKLAQGAEWLDELFTTLKTPLGQGKNPGLPTSLVVAARQELAKAVQLDMRQQGVVAPPQGSRLCGRLLGAILRAASDPD